MPALGVRKTAWQSLSARDRTLIRHLGDILQLGQPAEFETAGAVRWFIFDDMRFTPSHIAYFGCVLANLDEIPAGYTLPELMVPGDPVSVEVPVWQTEIGPDGFPVVVVDENGDPVPLLDENGDPVTRTTWVPGPKVPVPGTVDYDQLRRDAKAFCESPARTNPLVLPKDVEFSEGGNHWQELLDAQGVPSAVQMADTVPASWSPVEVDV